ncbi:MAG: tRNA (N6-isopentenyl adenosine(37)-C2)-methylthiotransferase MiaB [Gemmatimonadota bacterium]
MTKSLTEAGRAYVETYGCQMNVADGELMEGILAADGYEIVSSPEEADVILVNTCAIRDHAERRVLGRIGQLSGLKRGHPGLLIGVTGCMAQRLGRTLFNQASQVDLVVGPDAYRSLPDQLRRLRGQRGETEVEAKPCVVRPGKRRTQLAVLDLDPEESYEGLEQRREAGASAWVPIQRGCDHRCTFCIVPYVRGPEKNRRPEEVVAEVRGLAARGVTEVTLLGQTVNSYRRGDWNFARLLREFARIAGIRRVRFTSPHPNDVTRELVEVMTEEEAVCEHLHLPVQSGSDQVLRRMLRRYTVESYLEKVRMAREAIPDLSLSTDIIAAFPGETRSDFEATLDLVREVGFDEAYTYRYSPREGTPAMRLPAEDFLPEPEARARLAELITVCREIQGGINAGEVGRQDEVLVERDARDPGQVLGRTRRNKFVAFPSEGIGIGEYAWIELTGTTGATFQGALVGSLAAGAHR